MKSLGCLSVALTLGGPAVTVFGVVYCLFLGYGLPAPDGPPPTDSQMLHDRVGESLMVGGLLMHLAGWIVGLAAVVQAWRRRRLAAVKGFDVIQ